MNRRAFLIVFDSVGIGEAPDALDYGDHGANTLAHISQAVNGLHLPFMESMGLGNIPSIIPSGIAIKGVSHVDVPCSSFGAMREMSQGKDTTTGHWELAGLMLEQGFKLFPHEEPSFPYELIAEFESRTGRKVIGNKAASGIAIISELGPRQMKEGCWIVYTSADSVFQIAAHEGIIPLNELYRACEVARELCNPLFVGRIIARPFIGRPGAFTRTENRRDYSYPLPGPTVMDKLVENGINVVTVGKLDDIFAGRGISTSIHVENSTDAQNAVIDMVMKRHDQTSLIFANLIDFDMLYGHRRDAKGYAKALEMADSFLGDLMHHMTADDLLIVTADHGNDPTFTGTDHTREFVPLLVYRQNVAGKSLGIRQGFYDVAQSLSSFFGIKAISRGRTFL